MAEFAKVILQRCNRGERNTGPACLLVADERHVLRNQIHCGRWRRGGRRSTQCSRWLNRRRCVEINLATQVILKSLEPLPLLQILFSKSIRSKGFKNSSCRRCGQSELFDESSLRFVIEMS